MLRRTLAKNPVTIVFIVAIALGAILTNGWRGPDAAQQTLFATGYRSVVVDHQWWTILTSAFITEGGRQLIIVLIAAVVVVGFSERVLGSRRTVLAFFVTAIVGTGIGIVAQTVGIAIGELWSIKVQQSFTVDPMTPIIGTLMTASAFAGRLWRRRITVVTLSAVLLFLLYAGEPSDLYRTCAALAGLGLGYLYKPVVATQWWPRSSHRETRTLLAAVVAITALGPIVALVGGARLGPLTPLGLLVASGNSTDFSFGARCHTAFLSHGCLHAIALERISSAGPIVLTVLPLAVLLVAAYAILKGRRFGAWLAIAVNFVLSALAVLFYGLVPLFPLTQSGTSTGNWERTIDLTVCTLVPLAVALLVFFNRKHFTVRASRRTVNLYLASVTIALIFTASLYVFVGALIGNQFHPNVNVADLAADLPDRFAPVGFLKLEPFAFRPVGLGAVLLYNWVGPAFWLVVVIGALAVTLRPFPRVSRGRARARDLMRNAGGGSFSYWALWEGNHYWFTADGQAAVAYRVVNGIALTTSEPIGAPAAARAAIAEFARFCDDNGWTPFFYGIHPEFAEGCRELGWETQIIGDETVVYPAQWSTVGKQWQDVRTSINRAEREGVSAQWTLFSELPTRHRVQIEEISELWVSEKGLPEMGFTLGGIDELRDDGVGLMIAIDANDQIVGITSWLPSFSQGTVVGWTLDFMRRTPDGPNGVMEFLIARAAERFRDDGAEFMSLSTAPLTSNAAASPENTSIARMLRYIGGRLEPVYGFRSLHNFKRKFQPEFVPVFMAYPDSLSLPAIALALSRTYLPTMTVGQTLDFVRAVNNQPVITKPTKAAAHAE